MDLPGNAVGPSDIIQYRECPQRFAYGMRRHAELPERFAIYEGEGAEGPESESYPTAYGSAIHAAIKVVEETGCEDDEAIDSVWPDFSSWLEPDDIARMLEDLETYRSRTMLGYRLVGAELEMRMPLYRREDGAVMYLRGRVDVLYQHMQNPALFISRDYKSGRMKKSDAEIHKDIQQWLYNALIHYTYPECSSLTQLYDQLRYGETPTHKSESQRKQIVQWAIKQVKAMLGDDHLKPRQNHWCPYCPLVLDCRITHLSGDFWKNRLAALAPEKKVGRRIVVNLTDDHAGFSIYTELLPRIKASMKIQERFVKAVEGALKDMPAERREEFGYTLGNPKRIDKWDGSALRSIHGLVGDDFYQIVGLTKASLERMYGKESDLREQIESLARSEPGNPALKAPIE